MPKRFSLKPTETGPETSPWRINIPARISQSGKRERKFFATKRDADNYSKLHRIRVENYGTAATLLSPGQLEEAAKAFRDLAPFNATLNEAVTEYVSRREQDGQSVTFEKLFELFTEAKAKRSAAYLVQLKYTLPRFPGLHDKLVSRISARAIDEETRGMTPHVRNACLRVLRAVFNFGIKRDYLPENPIVKLDFERVPNGEVQILSHQEVRRLLSAAAEARDLVPYHAIGLLAGVRPYELLRLDWSDIDLAEGHILIRAEVAKNRRRRIIDISPNLSAWLKPHKATGPVTSLTNLRTRLRAIRASAGLGSWKQDIMRHSFASYWLAQHGDINKLTLMMGHTTTTMLWKHYHKAAKRTEAEKYWKIAPARTRGKIVPFAAA
jgi:integrase